jgi:NAD-dependent SIR2 family protein deacetylase
MAYTVDQFIALDLTRQAGSHGQVRCAKCQSELRENITGYRCGSDGPRCSDCYFGELSDLVEAHPVGLPALRR